jgi:small-conductance mechanosensitive channel
MKIFKVLYYNFYLFYKKILKDDDPHFTTVLALSFLFSLYAFSICDIFLTFFFHSRTSLNFNIGLLITITVVMYIIFLHEKKGDYIVKEEKPVIYSNKISKVITITIFIIGLLIIFFERILIKLLTCP